MPRPGKEPAMEGFSYRSVFLGRGKTTLMELLPGGADAKTVVEDAVFGHHAALACHMSNQSYFRKSAVTWDGGIEEHKS